MNLNPNNFVWLQVKSQAPDHGKYEDPDSYTNLFEKT